MENPMNRKTLLEELPLANAELGEFFALELNNMVVQSGITNPKAEPYELRTPSWKNRANNPNLTPEETKQLKAEYRQFAQEHADSFMLFIAKNVGNTTGKINYKEYEEYMLKYRFGHFKSMNKPEYIKEVKDKLAIAFKRIASCSGKRQEKDYIDRFDMAVFIYALTIKNVKDENGKFAGFEANAVIQPRIYAVDEHFLFIEEENLFDLKIRSAYNMMTQK